MTYKILIVKMSSLGDVIHTLPCVSDLMAYVKHSQHSSPMQDIVIDWVCEKSFAQIPSWHPSIRKVFPIELRKWRKSIFQLSTWKEVINFLQLLRTEQYDVIIDAQGLIKSALVCKMAKKTTASGVIIGLDKDSIKEKIAAWFYDKQINVLKNRHAIIRVRELFAKALNYPYQHFNTSNIDYGCTHVDSSETKIVNDGFENTSENQISNVIASRSQDTNLTTIDGKCIFLFHGTTWKTKHYPQHYWVKIAKLLSAKGFVPLVTYGNAQEEARALEIKNQCTEVVLLPRMSLNDLAGYIKKCMGAISVDTGLSHISAALNVPTLTLYGPTSDVLTGTLGPKQRNIKSTLSCSPCFKKKCQLLAQTSGAPVDSMDMPCFLKLEPAGVVSQFFKLMEEVQS